MNDREARRHPDEEALHRYAEDDLRPDAARAVEEHLDGCEGCREEVGEIRALLRRAAELPRGIRPPRDLWPGVEARIRGEEDRPAATLAFPSKGRTAGGATDGERGATGGAEDASVTSIPGLREAAPWLAAAAAVLVAVTAGATFWLTGGGGTAFDPGPAAVASGPAADSAPGTSPVRTSPVLVNVEQVEAGYRPMVDRLTGVLESRGDRLPPETREVVERNLRIIDAAIAEAESALARHPASPELLRALDRSYQRKIDLLRRSAQLTAQM